MPLSVFTIELVARILVIAKDSGMIARKTGRPFVQFISREISQATSSLTFSTRNSILETRSSRLETRDSKLSSLESRGSRDCQLTFERYCIFVLAAEALAIAVRQDATIKGISLGGEETKLLQYADDMTAALADVSSAQALFNLLETFKKASGLTINFTKTEGMSIGSSKSNKAKPFGIKWPSERNKALGVFYTYDQKLLLEKNFSENFDKVKKLLNVWSSRGLSIYGKVTIIKSLMIPKFVYLASIMLR